MAALWRGLLIPIKRKWQSKEGGSWFLLTPSVREQSDLEEACPRVSSPNFLSSSASYDERPVGSRVPSQEIGKAVTHLGPTWEGSCIRALMVLHKDSSFCTYQNLMFDLEYEPAQQAHEQHTGSRALSSWRPLQKNKCWCCTWTLCFLFKWEHSAGKKIKK